MLALSFIFGVSPDASNLSLVPWCVFWDLFGLSDANNVKKSKPLFGKHAE
jgi:hypothetical protein